MKGRGFLNGLEDERSDGRVSMVEIWYRKTETRHKLQLNDALGVGCQARLQ